MLLNFLCCVFVASAAVVAQSLQIHFRESHKKLSPELEGILFKNHRHKPTHYQLLEDPFPRRWERSANSPDDGAPSSIHISLPLLSNYIEVDLEKIDIAHPNITYKIRHDEGEDEEVEIEPNLDCFYSGGVGDKSVVVSTCSGVNGVILDNGKAYQLEQIDPSIQTSSKYKREILEPLYVTYPLKSMVDFEPSGMESWASVSEPLKRPVAELLPEGEDSMVARSDRVRRRIIKGPYTVELAVFVDSQLYNYIKKRYPGTDKQVQAKVMEIVMTLVNAVHRLYNDKSLGDEKVSMLVKRVEVLGTKKGPSHSKGDIYKYLKNFCSWQAKENPKSAKGHWDHALLLSGHDLWNEVPSRNSTVGLAYVGGMCQSYYSCTVNEGTTLAAAYIIAHEMGHNFNMKHDGTGLQSSCSHNKFIMASVMTSGATTWSTCSVSALKNFLKKNGGCLTPDYTSSAGSTRTHEGKLPGRRFGADEQCMYMYGKGWKHFTSTSDAIFNNVCHEIWCRKGRLLRTPSASALEGTPCGNDKVCKRSKCVLESQTPVKKKKTVIKTKKPKKSSKKNDAKKVTKDSNVKAKKGKLKKTNNKNNKNNTGDKKSNSNKKNTFSSTDGDSTKIKTKTNVKKSKKPPKYRRIETPTHIVIRERVKFIPGKGWKIKTIRIKKSKKMLGISDKKGRKGKKKKKKNVKKK